jgi:hypothetical protein
MFTMEIGEAPKGTVGAVKEGEAGHTKLEDMIRELSGTLTGIKHEQEYMHVSINFVGYSHSGSPKNWKNHISGS